MTVMIGVRGWLEVIPCMAGKQTVALQPGPILGTRQPLEEQIALTGGMDVFIEAGTEKKGSGPRSPH